MTQETIRGVPVGEVLPQDKDLYLMCVRTNEMNPTFIVAQILAQPQRGLTVRFSTEVMGQKVEGMVAIYVDHEAYEVLSKFDETPEAEVLEYAVFPPDLFYGKPDLSVCQWGVETKRKVNALYWQNRAALYQKWADSNPGVDNSYQILADEAQTKAKELLGELTSLTLEDARLLLKPVVDRVLAEQFSD